MESLYLVTELHFIFYYWVDEKSPVGPDQVIAIRRIAKIPLVKKLMKKWSITQDLTFKEQLDSGIRYFDLRVSSKPGEAGQEIYFIHGLFGTTVCDGLVEINNFLTHHPKEVIFLDFNHFYAMDMNHHMYLISKIEEIFGSKLCTKECVENVTLQSLWEKQQQVLVFYHHSICEIYPVLWAGNKMPAPWANTTNVHKLLQFLETTLKERAKHGTFHVSQAILTPRAKTFAWHLSRGLKNTLVHRNLPFILNWVKLQKPGVMGVNIITSDFVEQVDFAATIIGLNNLLLEGKKNHDCLKGGFIYINYSLYFNTPNRFSV
uniref:Phosphatidylinositol specific phospholipase C X domain containing 2 n=1 Tax=Pseudonaja textilis TaxID=8673 RepID=A0A670Y5S2_PSETE